MTAAANPWATTRRSERVVRRSAGVWDLEPDVLDEEDKSDETRFPDLVAFAGLSFSVLTVVGLPLNELLVGMVVALAISRRPVTAVASTPLLAGTAVLVGYLVVTSFAHDMVDVRRLLHLVLWAALAHVIATGRIHLPSAARGAAIGIVLSVVLSAAGFSPSGYTGRLAGFFGDPNAAGYVLTVIGTVALGLTTTRRLRTVLLVLIPVAVLMTYSRTSLMALGFAMVWVLVGRRLGQIGGIGLVGAMLYLITHIPRELRLFGPFSDRTGSDELRERLIAQEHLDVALNKWFGAGAGTANVEIQGNTFFYHSSYLALQREGGLVAVGLLIGIIVLVAFALLGRPPELRNPWLEAALICLVICGVNLGEVLVDLPAAVAIGAALFHLRTTPHGTHAAAALPPLRAVTDG